MGNPCGLNGWLARFHSWPPLFLGVLRASRHAHATSLRDRSRAAHHTARLSGGFAAASRARHRATLGCSRTDHFRRHCFVGGIHVVAARSPQACRPSRCANRLSRQGVACRVGRRRCRARLALCSRSTRTHFARDLRTDPLRRRLLCRCAGPQSTRSPFDPRHAWPPRRLSITKQAADCRLQATPCGAKVPKKLSDREHVCTKCGLIEKPPPSGEGVSHRKRKWLLSIWRSAPTSVTAKRICAKQPAI